MRTLIVGSLVFLCTTALGSSRENLLRDLAIARSSWAEHGSQSYQFTITTSCACTPAARLGPIQVTVMGEKVVRSVYVGPAGKGYTYGQLVSPEIGLTTVSELFKEIEFEIATRPSKSAGFSVQYDVSDGHPTRYQYDDSGGDDSFTMVLSHFRRR